MKAQIIANCYYIELSHTDLLSQPGSLIKNNYLLCEILYKGLKQLDPNTPKIRTSFYEYADNLAAKYHISMYNDLYRNTVIYVFKPKS